MPFSGIGSPALILCAPTPPPRPKYSTPGLSQQFLSLAEQEVTQGTWEESRCPSL